MTTGRIVLWDNIIFWEPLIINFVYLTIRLLVGGVWCSDNQAIIRSWIVR